MITIHVEADTAGQLRHDVLTTLGFGDKVIRVLLSGAPDTIDLGDEGPEVIDTTGMTSAQVTAAITEPAAEEPKKRSSRAAKKAEPAATPPETTQEVIAPDEAGGEDSLEIPAFLKRDKEEPKVEHPSIEDLRSAAEKASPVASMKAIFDEVRKFKKPDGTAAMKLSEVPEADRAALIAALEKLSAKKG